MPSIKYRGTPDEIATLVEALRCSPLIKSVNHGDLFKYAEDNRTATTYITYETNRTVKSTAPISIYKPRKKTPKGTRQLDGYVYLLKELNGTSYKIGKTANPKSRRRTFGVKLPFAVDYVHTIETDDMHQLEKLLHQRFASKRIRGEFFELDDKDVAFIVSLGVKCTIEQYRRLK